MSSLSTLHDAHKFRCAYFPFFHETGSIRERNIIIHMPFYMLFLLCCKFFLRIAKGGGRVKRYIFIMAKREKIRKCIFQIDIIHLARLSLNEGPFALNSAFIMTLIGSDWECFERASDLSLRLKDKCSILTLIFHHFGWAHQFYSCGWSSCSEIFTKFDFLHKTCIDFSL